MTRREEDEMVAHALEIEPALLVFATELLADLDVLGANASLIIDALRELGVSGQSVVVDLGCGKGGVSIAIAASLGCQVVGVASVRRMRWCTPRSATCWGPLNPRWR